ncbi:hypothetical protein MHYP_G00005850 [Metynnis hypsauchen]
MQTLCPTTIPAIPIIPLIMHWQQCPKSALQMEPLYACAHKVTSSLPFTSQPALSSPHHCGDGRGATQVIPIDFRSTTVSSPGANKPGHIDAT